MGSGASSSGWQGHISPTQGPDYTNQGKKGSIGLGYKHEMSPQAAVEPRVNVNPSGHGSAMVTFSFKFGR